MCRQGTGLVYRHHISIPTVDLFHRKIICIALEAETWPGYCRMSRWLKGLDQVSNLIGKLDDRAATVAEEVSGKDDNENVAGIGEIVWKRGLEDYVLDEEDGMDFDGAPDRDTSLTHHETMSDQNAGNSLESRNQEGIKTKTHGSDHDNSTGNYNDRAEQLASSESVSMAGGETTNLPQTTEKSTDSNHGSEVELTTAAPEQKESERQPKVEQGVSSKDTQREVRTLRKHVVRLNTTLEDAENEIAALRKELRNAAKRMDKDKANAKEQREAFEKQKREDMKAIHEENERALTEQRAAFEEQMTSFKRTISELEETRRQEGEKWNKEIAQALDREQEMGTRVGVLEVSSTINELNILNSWRKLTGDCWRLDQGREIDFAESNFDNAKSTSCVGFESRLVVSGI